MCYFFQKNKKLVAVYFKKITCCAKREKKNNLPRGKSQPLPWISNGLSLTSIMCFCYNMYNE